MLLLTTNTQTRLKEKLLPSPVVRWSMSIPQTDYFAELDRVNDGTAVFRLFKANTGGDPMFMNEFERPVASLRPSASIGDMYTATLGDDDTVAEMEFNKNATQKRRDQRDRQADLVFDAIDDGLEDGTYDGYVEHIQNGVAQLRIDGKRALGPVHVRIEELPLEAAQSGVDVEVDVWNDRIVGIEPPLEDEE